MEKTKALHLAFIYHVPFWQEDGEILTIFPPIGRYVDSLAPHFDKITIVTPKRSTQNKPLYKMKATNLSLYTVKPHPNIQSYYFHLLHFYLSFFTAMHDWDMINVRMPTLTGFPGFIASRFFNRPMFLVVVGENFNYVTLAGYSGIKKWIANVVAHFQDLLLNWMVRHTITFTNGQDLFEKFKPYGAQVHMMRSSTISTQDLLPGFRDTCIQAPYKILTVAMIGPRKGTALIPEIIENLKNRGIDISWNYVGSIEGNSGKQELEKTLGLAAKLGVSSQFNFIGEMGFNELIPLYRASDIFVLPTYMEGIPRVILEAQASGLPVITTHVGGIPQAVEDGVDAILLSPGDVNAMADAIELLIKSRDLREKLINNGLKSAERFTLEAETEQMIEKVENYYLQKY